MDKQQRDKEERENIIKMIRDLKPRGVHNSAEAIVNHHGYIVLAELIKQKSPEQRDVEGFGAL